MVTLTDAEIERFVADGFLALRGAFPADLAAAAVDALWTLLPDIDRGDPATWTQPVVRIPGSGHAPVVAAINTGRLTGAIDDLVGVGRWERRHGYGTFPVRFPSVADPGDAGWHIDGSFGDPPWYRVNVASRGRALLLLMLFTDVGPDDAPTRVKAGSHRDVARALAGVGPDGVAFVPEELAPAALERPTELVTGHAGDVFLCHPFLVHAASWPHRGTSPRVLGQPAIHHPEGAWLGGFDYAVDDAPVPRAVRLALTEIPGEADGR